MIKISKDEVVVAKAEPDQKILAPAILPDTGCKRKT